MSTDKTNEDLEFPDWWDDGSDEEEGFHDCPNCNHEYDEIDYEFQICHWCGFNANTLII